MQDFAYPRKLCTLPLMVMQHLYQEKDLGQDKRHPILA